MLFAFAFGVDKDVIEVYNHENVKLLYQDIVDIALKYGRCVGQSKRHDLVFEVAIVGSEGCLPFTAFSDPYLMVGIGEIEFGKTSSPT